MPAIAVVRVRGHARIRRDAVETMEMLRLHRPNHCVVLPQDETTKGMLQVVKDYVTWGEVGHETVARLLFHKGEVAGGARLTDSYVKENSEHASILSFAKALEKGEARLTDVKGMKPVLRLPPPRGGYRGAKTTFVDGGALGYRGPAMDKLVDRMLPKAQGAK
ncbi:MAG TPA: 50S ribosomal protein L30 [Thermoplasmata archaeon]|jgi:large subunit ribosomal protein L30|nr:50S ribosomal protein L30 [Thermoplasmata archaeon]